MVRKIEVEAKIQVDNFFDYLCIVRELGGVKTTAHKETSFFFDTKKRKLKSEDSVLRIKTTTAGDEYSTFTFKGPQEGESKYKAKEEIEMFVSDVETLKTILLKTGFVLVGEYTKYREIWEIKDTFVCFDDVPGLGYFIEVEGKQSSISRILKKLGLDKEPVIMKGYLGLVRKRGSKYVT